LEECAEVLAKARGAACYKPDGVFWDGFSHCVCFL
jgi:hypothetical protein